MSSGPAWANPIGRKTRDVCVCVCVRIYIPTRAFTQQNAVCHISVCVFKAALPLKGRVEVFNAPVKVLSRMRTQGAVWLGGESDLLYIYWLGTLKNDPVVLKRKTKTRVSLFRWLEYCNTGLLSPFFWQSSWTKHPDFFSEFSWRTRGMRYSSFSQYTQGLRALAESDRSGSGKSLREGWVW
jgi:hypothetical protein